MAQAEEKRASIDSQVLFQLQAPEVPTPQVLVTEAAMEKIIASIELQGTVKQNTSKC
ncbi:unnamed protein product [marine sediment metagenome]|uniref:Uncharacterized protein n=1 Tax=marine sediment metagenome TaxID=412755 RepID=X1U3Q4_9ZZZZ